MRNFVSAALVLFLLFAVIGNVLLYRFGKNNYAYAKKIAVFPSNVERYRGMNQGLGAKSSKRVLLFGDSRIEQWKELPVIPNTEFINRGIPSETTAQMRMRFEQDVLALNPDVVILQMGINDLVAIGVLPERQEEIVHQCYTNIRYFVEQLRARKIRTILLTTIPPAEPGVFRLPVWSNQIDAEVVRLNTYWLGRPPDQLLQIVDTQSLLQQYPGRWYTNVNSDTLHLTKQGYAYLNQAITPLLH